MDEQIGMRLQEAAGAELEEVSEYDRPWSSDLRKAKR
jgi:hypothetical protein